MLAFLNGATSKIDDVLAEHGALLHALPGFVLGPLLHA